MADLENIKERLRNYILQHPEVSKNGFIQGLDGKTGKIIINVNGQEKYITIDELEIGHLNNNVSQTPIQKEEEMIEVMEEPTVNNSQTVINNQPAVNYEQKVVTLKEIEDAAKIKDEAFINNALGDFAIDKNTGKFRFDKLMIGATENTTKAVISFIQNKKDFPSDKSLFDAKGNLIADQVMTQPNADIENIIRKSFENIKVYVEVARLKNIVFNEEQIENAYKNYSNGVHKKLIDYGLEKKDDNVVSLDEYKTKKEDNSKKIVLKPDTNLKKAGFADILVLTIIVLIYAVIIINLVSKLK